MYIDPADRKYDLIVGVALVLTVAFIIGLNLVSKKQEADLKSLNQEEKLKTSGSLQEEKPTPFDLKSVGSGQKQVKLATKNLPSCIQLLEVFEKNKQKNLPILDFNKDGKIDKADAQVIFKNMQYSDWCQYILDKVDLK